MKKLLSFCAALLCVGSMMAAPLAMDTISCDSARTAALAGKTDSAIVKGYVTSIAQAFNESKKNVSFWMADTQDGGQVFEVYQAVCNSADEVPTVGSLVWAKGKLKKYRTTPELDAKCTFGIIQAAEPAKNLGHKSIAEFLALKNKKDTCILTGVVTNIVMDKDDATKYNKYGNFHLVEGTDSLYIYGLLTADGQKGQFIEMGIDEGDTLSLKAIYTEFKGKPQAANAIFVALSKKQQPQPQENVDVTMTGLMFQDKVATAGWWQLYGDNDNFYITLSNSNTITQAAGSYTAADLDQNFSYIVVLANKADTISFTAGSFTLTVDDNNSVTVVGELTGSDSKIYKLNLSFQEPKPDTTVDIVIPQGSMEDAYGYAFVAGKDDNDNYIQFLLTASYAAPAGTYTWDNVYPQYSGISINGIVPDIYSGSIVITANPDGSYTINADILCYNNTLYKFVITIPAKFAVTFAQPQNGTLVIMNEGTAIESGDEFVAGTVLTVEANPAEGFILGTLTAGGVDISKDKSFKITDAAVEVIATFVANPTGINNVEANKHLIKVIKNGQLVIQKDGKSFNVMGTELY